MKSLEERIVAEGVVVKDNILKVDSFLNHQIDPVLMKAIGDELARLFKDEQVTKILTIEVSGIAPSLLTGLALKVPIIFARKQSSKIMDGQQYVTSVQSHTKKKTNQISVAKAYLQKNDNVLLIDDFLANGHASLGLIEICHQAQANIVGLGVVIEKSFQPGRQLVEEAGVRVESLVRIASFEDNKIIFKKD
jgi:xanthine phosphoribosyltransferase